MLSFRLVSRCAPVATLAVLVMTLGFMGCGETPPPEEPEPVAAAFPQLAGYAEMEIPADNRKRLRETPIAPGRLDHA